MMNIPPEVPPQRLRLPHGIPPWIRGDTILFVTICCSPRGLNQLCTDSAAAAIWESVAFRQRHGDWSVHLWLLMPDHLHALISFPQKCDTAKVVANWKEIVAKRTTIRWQRDFFEHRIRSDESMREKTDYIRQNPVRKGLVAKPEDWKFVWTP